jgi:hypothetical protein
MDEVGGDLDKAIDMAVEIYRDNPNGPKEEDE